MGLFDNASVVINNKEVQSIITSNGGILYEKAPSISLILASNKSVIQSGETATLTATLTEGGTPLSGEVIIFDGVSDTSITTDNTDTSYTITGDYKLTIPSHQNHVDFCVLGTSEKSVTFGYSSGDESCYMDIYDGDTIFITGDSVYVIDDSIYYLDEDGNPAVFDASDYDTEEISTPFYIGGVVIEYGIPSATTNSSGVASVSYVGNGIGILNIQAIYNSIFSSEIYELWDTLFYDIGTSSDHRTDYTATDLSVSWDDEGTIIKEENGASKTYRFNTTLQTNTIIEVDVAVLVNSNNIRFRVGAGDAYINTTSTNTRHFKVVIDDSTIKYYIDGEYRSQVNISTTTQIRFTLNNATIKFSNFKVYPV